MASTGAIDADAMKFNGPAPEIINARLAMLGFLYAASNEVCTGNSPACMTLWQIAHAAQIPAGRRRKPASLYTNSFKTLRSFRHF